MVAKQGTTERRHRRWLFSCCNNHLPLATTITVHGLSIDLSIRQLLGRVSLRVCALGVSFCFFRRSLTQAEVVVKSKEQRVRRGGGGGVYLDCAALHRVSC